MKHYIASVHKEAGKLVNSVTFSKICFSSDWIEILKMLINEKVIKKIQNIRFLFTHPLEGSGYVGPTGLHTTYIDNYKI